MVHVVRAKEITEEEKRRRAKRDGRGQGQAKTEVEEAEEEEKEDEREQGLRTIKENRKQLVIRSVKRGICPIAKSTMNEPSLQLWPDALRMHKKAVFLLPV